MRLSFFLSEALESLRRNWVMTIASVLTVLVTMAILGVVLVTDKNLKEGTTSLTNRVEIEVFIKGAPPQQSSQSPHCATRSRAHAAGSRAITYVSQEQALEDFKKTLGPNAEADRERTSSATRLPASYKIFVKDPNEVDQVAQQFFNDPNVDNDPGTTNGVSYAKQTVRNLLGTVNLVEKAMWVVTMLFALAAILLTSTTVRLSIFARRREVEIMQLVGATNWFIRWPFVLEGFITGLVGSLVAALAVWGANVLVYNWIHQSKLDFLRPIRYPLVAQSGTWPLGPHPHARAGRRRARRPGQRAGVAPLPARLTPPGRPPGADTAAASRLKGRRPGDYHGRSCVRSSPSSPCSSSWSPCSPPSWPATPCAARRHRCRRERRQPQRAGDRRAQGALLQAGRRGEPRSGERRRHAQGACTTPTPCT